MVTPLEFAANSGDKEMIELLKNHGAVPPSKKDRALRHFLSGLFGVLL